MFLNNDPGKVAKILGIKDVKKLELAMSMVKKARESDKQVKINEDLIVAAKNQIKDAEVKLKGWSKMAKDHDDAAKKLFKEIIKEEKNKDSAALIMKALKEAGLA